MLQLDIIEPSTSPWASRFLLVPQPGREDREVVDYRPLNGVTKKNVYPLPRIDDTLMLLHGLKFVSTLDGSRAFGKSRKPSARSCALRLFATAASTSSASCCSV